MISTVTALFCTLASALQPPQPHCEYLNVMFSGAPTPAACGRALASRSGEYEARGLHLIVETIECDGSGDRGA